MIYFLVRQLMENNLGLEGFLVGWLIIYILMMLAFGFGYLGAKLLIGTPKIKKSVIWAMIPISFIVSLIIIKLPAVIYYEITKTQQAEMVKK